MPIILEKELENFFGHKDFRGFQKEVILNVLNKEDTFVIMPTGGGKSLTYQLPALVSEGMAIIISPLIALMKNQVDTLKQNLPDENMVDFFNSTLTKAQLIKVKDNIQKGITKILYTSPETLSREDHIGFLKGMNISFFAVDEAHCVSEWGHDFRPEYRNLNSILRGISDAPIMALTATATPEVQDDIAKSIGMEDAKVFKASFNRPNLFYEVRNKTDKCKKEIVEFIKRRNGQSGIIYCSSRSKVEELSHFLEVNEIKAAPYHAGLEKKRRSMSQDDFLNQNIDVIVATVAFGMGIDKPDVRFVIHYDVPKSLEGYYQETGRAGRDGQLSHCLSFYSYKDLEKKEKLISSQKANFEKTVALGLIQDVINFCETAISRRKFLLNYFGEEFDEKSGEGFDMDDNTINPKKKISVKEDYNKVVEIIKSNSEKLNIREIVNKLSIKEGKESIYWKSIVIQSLVGEYFIKELTKENYGKIRLSKKGEDLSKSDDEYLIVENNHTEYNEVVAMKSSVIDEDLFKLLKKLTKSISDKNKVPPYAVFEEKILEEMTFSYPTNVENLKSIGGIGEGKLKKYGEIFTTEIKKYVEDNGIEVNNDINISVKNVEDKGNTKISIIKDIDKKITLDDIAEKEGISLDELITELEKILDKGTKINLRYYLDDIFDEEDQEEIMDYFMNAESSSVSEAVKELGDSYDVEDIRLIRLRFLNEIVN